MAAIYGLNPMVGVIEGFRWSILGTIDARLDDDVRFVRRRHRDFCGGLYYFRKTEIAFADVI